MATQNRTWQYRTDLESWSNEESTKQEKELPGSHNSRKIPNKNMAV